MRIISYNLNGIRAAVKKGFIEWLQTDPADIICVQETKAHEVDIPQKELEALGYHTYWYSAEKKGYSGVGVITKTAPKFVQKGNGVLQSDAEGRVIRLDFEHFTLINAYFPSGTSGDVRQDYKYQWLDEFYTYVNDLKKSQANIIVTGDYNIAHTEIDIHDPKGNKKSSGFLPEERAWMDKYLAAGWIDSFRFVHPDRLGAYSWWSQRFPSVRLNNKGWRIDYITVTKDLEKNIVGAEIYPDVKHSDHCPISVDLKF
ncbi:exodeoxyribonuclease III [Rhizosphaericola mali]|uniref:Exodeoxyribonuclease III n=1 Tax=Rhizosphaericola mali TaxID=2545455 RepID=A0A5P2FYR8_9BACT|nr:exodeoxyribonuclease III [Rhizosphaericola mali]QES87528.1 exodeoxyribonuclease III [Rhizosphaericola mali]